MQLTLWSLRFALTRAVQGDPACVCRSLWDGPGGNEGGPGCHLSRISTYDQTNRRTNRRNTSRNATVQNQIPCRLCIMMSHTHRYRYRYRYRYTYTYKLMCMYICVYIHICNLRVSCPCISFFNNYVVHVCFYTYVCVCVCVGGGAAHQARLTKIERKYKKWLSDPPTPVKVGSSASKCCRSAPHSMHPGPDAHEARRRGRQILNFSWCICNLPNRTDLLTKLSDS